ncbi:GPW/gp25 family protein [Hafnia paralvei]|uniref:GPW/gp25 family protein n=1 Tax=Hafnia paralvei TaxID=546367 RepID=UPI001D10233D|nr:GPW/gp25 family protein [Hafnia paralvei]
MLTSLILRLSDDNPEILEDEYQKTKDINVLLIEEIKMLLDSRVRMLGVENIELVKDTIINYGFNESFSNIKEQNSRKDELERRLKKMIIRFEPRLKNVSITNNITNENIILFNIRANYLNTIVFFELKWDDYTGVFYLNE